MPDIQLCPGQDCQVAENCMRCPISGTVATFSRQVWGGIPGEDATCKSYIPVWKEEMPTLEQRLMRVVEYFCGFMVSKESTRNNYKPREFKDYIAQAFYHTIAWNDNNNPELGDEIIAWLKSSSVDSDDVIEVIENNLLGVICLMDTHDGGTRYIDQVVKHFDKPKPKLHVIQGNRSVN